MPHLVPFEKSDSRTALAFAAVPIFFLILWGANGFSTFGWDAIWYRDIASGGYRFNGDVLQQQNVAFLPGYPLLIYLLHVVTHIEVATCQYIVSLSCYVGGSFSFYKVFCRWFSVRQSLLAIGIFSVNPFAIYLFNGYSESLMYLLCGLFFLAANSKRYWLSALALSYALITRPHAISLYPVLIYKLAHDHGLFEGGLKWSGKQAMNFVRSSADHLFLTLLFPIFLTCFWYVKFGDSLLYLNALTAWGAAGSNSVFRQVGLLISSLLEIQTQNVAFAGGSIKVVAPHQFAAINVILNLVATAYLVKRRCYDLAVFCMGLLAFWFFNSTSADSGRHALLLMAMPIALAAALVAATSSITSNGHAGVPGVIWRWGLGFAGIGFLLLSVYHYVFYALIQLKGGWIS